MTAYYNEHDPFAAAWLRELIKAGLIADGEVDERSIEDVLPNELAGFTQCHFFAGIGGWSLALRLAGWPDDRPVWTGSCPCQPFSAAGKGKGHADERHLWPAFHHLIKEHKPGVVFGEQVEAAIKHGWLDLVQSDLEGIGYAFAAVGLPAACVGAPHIRARAWFVADTNQDRLVEEPKQRVYNAEHHAEPRRIMGDPSPGGQRIAGASPREGGRIAQPSAINQLGNTEHAGLEGYAGYGDDSHEPGRIGAQPGGSTAETGATRGFWHPAEWISCRDGKARPVEPGTFPLASGVPARVGRLRGYGNAIVPPLAKEFIESYLEAIA